MDDVGRLSNTSAHDLLYLLSGISGALCMCTSHGALFCFEMHYLLVSLLFVRVVCNLLSLYEVYVYTRL